MPVLILASGSPRRFEMMSRLTDDFLVSVPDIDETPGACESPEEMVLRLAEEKARAVYEKYGTVLPVLAADTIVVSEGILGKPESPEEAFDMISALSGKCHEVITGVALIEGKTGQLHSFAEITRVFFGDLSDAEIRKYVESKEPFDKAGAYGIQGDGGKFIKRIDGCFYNVMGFPLNSIYSMLRKHGII